MCKIAKKILCIGSVALALFIGIAIWGGGDKFRWLGEKVGGIMQKEANSLGKKADKLQEEVSKTKDRIKENIEKKTRKLTGRDKEKNK